MVKNSFNWIISRESTKVAASFCSVGEYNYSMTKRNLQTSDFKSLVAGKLFIIFRRNVDIRFNVLPNKKPSSPISIDDSLKMYPFSILDK